MSELTNRLKQVLALPKPIIHDENRWYFTHDLRSDMTKIQACLAGAEIKQGDRILLSYPNSYQFVSLYLAIIDYGAVVVPINPDMPEYEFISFIKRCRPVSGFVGSQHFDFVLKNEISGITLDSLFRIDSASILRNRFDNTGSKWIQKSLSEKAAREQTYQTVEDSLAVLLYTSGTTGNPKAVGLTHGQIFKTAQNIISSHELSPQDITYCFLPLFHINAQVVAVLSTFLSEGKIVIAPKFSASKFWRVIHEHKVTWVSAVPAVISILLNTPRPEQISKHLRFIRSASSQLPMVNARRFEQGFGIPVIQSYGMTEAASQICVNPLPPGKRVLGSVGLPVGLELQIVDPDGRPCPAHEVGEIVIKGESVVSYYIEADNQNDFQNGWFHTGDLGYVDKEGYVFIVGRTKEMINRGGEKISPYEVEDVIRQIPAVKEAAVIGMPHPLYGEEVTAFIVCHEGKESRDEITKIVKDHCQNSLSSYKCPAEVYVVDEIPVGPTGKIKRTQLKEISLNNYYQRSKQKI